MPRPLNPPFLPIRLFAATLAIMLVSSCSSNLVATPPPTIAPAGAADSPPVTDDLPGIVRPLPGNAHAAAYDAATASLVVLTYTTPDRATVTVLSPDATTTATDLPGPATAMTADGEGRVALASRGGYYRFDIANRSTSRFDVADHGGVDFTAIARRDDGNLVLGSADGTVYTLASDTGVANQLKIFARVDAIVTQRNTAVVLDRGQTSVTSLNPDGDSAEQALRAGAGATTMAADAAGRVLVADTRGGELLVYGVDPLMLRQRYPVAGAPYGLATSATESGLAWVAQTATNTVVGYDLSTGIPVEKVRLQTVQQPNTLAYDATSDTLYVASGAGKGVQVIANAAGSR